MRIISSFANTMTPARQQRKRYRDCGAAIAGLLLALSTGLPVTSAATTERIVVDWHTGLAIGGYDPVAFFTDGKPIAGRPDFELRYGGAVWRFCNIGNRAAFAGVARGLAVAGNPDHWLIIGERLFLFYDQARRERFSADPERAIAAAERKWPEVSRTLSP
jgi:hypothetical protein